MSRLLLAGAAALGFATETAPGWLPIVSIGLAFAVITVLHMTLGEQAPKMWALRRADWTAMKVAWTLRIFTAAFGPLIAVINGISNWMLRVAGLPAGSHGDSTHTAEEIRSILSLSARAGHISDRELELTENVFRMIELEVRHVLVPRVDIELLSLERSPQQNLDQIRASSHSRLPLCERDLDTIVGFVHGKDVLEQVLRGDALPDLRPLARPPLIVPDSMPLSDFLVELQGNLGHCGAVVDEHGTIVGLAFREDTLEEIVGPLGDEFDDETPDWKEIDEGTVEVRGRLPLPEVRARLDLALGEAEDESRDTIGGHVTARLGRLARVGDAVPVGPFVATVLDVGRRRIQRLRLERAPAPEAPGAVGTEAHEG